MKIEMNGEKITVVLTCRDMSDLDITYEELDYSNIETRRVIWTILDEAKRTLGTEIDADGRLLIEASPAEDGGCILNFSSSPISDSKSKKRLIMKKQAEPFLFSAESRDEFLEAFTLLKTLKSAISYGKIYEYKSDFYMIIKPKPNFSDMLELKFCEYGEVSPCDSVKISKLEEYGKYMTSV